MQGTYSSSSGTSACSNCAAGYSSIQQATDCTLCPSGHFSLRGSTCTGCAYGTAQSSLGATACSICPAGQYAASSASDTSGGVESPTAQGATLCNNCPAGRFSATPGVITCQQCGEKVYSFAGSTVCGICNKNFYLDASNECSKCPDGADCSIPGASTLRHLSLQSGHWRITYDSLDINECVYPGSCIGGLGVARNGSSPYCAVGYTGILCAVCARTYYFNPDANACLSCSESSFASPTMVLFLIILILVVSAIGIVVIIRPEWAAVLRDYGQKQVESEQDKGDEFKGKLKETVLASLPTIQTNAKAINSSYQIAVNVAFNCQIRFPVSFERLLGAFHFVNLDIVPSLGIGCAGNYDLSSKVFVVTLVPLAFAAILFGLFEFKKRQRQALSVKNTVNETSLLDSLQGLPDEDFALLLNIIDDFINNKGKLISPNEMDHDNVGQIISALTPHASNARISAQVDILFGSLALMDKAKLFEALDAKRQGDKQPTDESLIYLSMIFLLTYMVLISTSSTLFQFMNCREFPVPNQASQYYLYADYSIDCATSTYKGVKAYAAIMIIIFPMGSKSSCSLLFPDVTISL